MVREKVTTEILVIPRFSGKTQWGEGCAFRFHSKTLSGPKAERHPVQKSRQSGVLGKFGLESPLFLQKVPRYRAYSALSRPASDWHAGKSTRQGGTYHHCRSETHAKLVSLLHAALKNSVCQGRKPVLQTPFSSEKKALFKRRFR